MSDRPAGGVTPEELGQSEEWRWKGLIPLSPLPLSPLSPPLPPLLLIGKTIVCLEVLPTRPIDFHL